MTWWTGTRLVTGRAIRENLRSRTFKIVTAFLLLLSVAAVLLPQLLGQDERDFTLATAGEVPTGLAATLDASARAAELEVDYLAAADDDAVRLAVEEGDADAGLAGDVLYTAQPGGLFPALVGQAVVAVELADRLGAAGLDPEEIAGVQSVVPPEQVGVGGVEDADRAGVGFIVGIVLYLAVTFAGSAIATAVATEKSTRISEVLLAVLRPSQVMVGTVLAVGAVTFGQLLLLATPLAVAVRVTDAVGLPPVATTDIALGVVWFVLGFATYAFLFAAAGSLVDKLSDLSASITPITIVLVAGYMVGVTVATTDSEGAASVAASIFPLSAPLVMPIRWSVGEVPAYQLALAMVLSAATAALLAAFASRVYSRALLVTGRRARLRDVVGRDATG
ncbi:ABC transporter permease [Georgenia muralis]